MVWYGMVHVSVCVCVEDSAGTFAAFHGDQLFGDLPAPDDADQRGDVSSCSRPQSVSPPNRGVAVAWKGKALKKERKRVLKEFKNV